MRAIISAIVAFVAVAAPSAAVAQQPLIFGGSDAIGSVIDRTNAMFTKLVNERARDKAKVNFIQGEQLGSDVQVIEQMIRGSVHLYGDVLDWYSNWEKDLAILAWGFTFRDFDHAQKFLDSDLAAVYLESLRAKQGIKILAAAPAQVRVMFAKKPVQSPDDLSGMKMRVPEIRTYLLLWQTLGTQPARVAWAEVFLGLKTGLIDAAEGPVLSAYAQKFHLAAVNVMRTDHLITIHHISMSDKAFQALSPDLQKIFLESAREAIAWSRKQSEEEMNDVYNKMKAEGATIIAVDKAPFAKKAAAGVATMETDGVWSKGLYEKLQAIR